jgi:Icc-related predicted phosphoesterase
MLICAVSDTHEQHDELVIQPCDLFIHAGDICFQQNPRPISALREFDEWLSTVPCRHRVVVPGNHDRVLEEPKNRALLQHAKVLVNSGVTIEGARIWGSPVTPLPGMAFGMPNAADRKRHWARIPKNIDILVTHSAPYGILDAAPGSNEHEGCPELREAVLRVKPRLHIFGHTHVAYGRLQTKDTLFINAALVGELFEMDRPPVMLNFQARPDRSR